MRSGGKNVDEIFNAPDVALPLEPVTDEAKRIMAEIEKEKGNKNDGK